jgi:hypothetical protein
MVSAAMVAGRAEVMVAIAAAAEKVGWSVAEAAEDYSEAGGAVMVMTEGVVEEAPHMVVASQVVAL